MKFFEKYHREIWILIGAFVFALIGDLAYGGIEASKEFLVGDVLRHISVLLSTVLTLMIMFRLGMSFITSKFFSTIFQRISHNIEMNEQTTPTKSVSGGKKK